MTDFIAILLYATILISLVATLFIILTFRKFYAGLGLTIILAYLIFSIHFSLELVLHNITDNDQALVVARISSVFLSTGMYLLHYFHDEISAEYRERKTMTLASIVWGTILGAAWLHGSIKIDDNIHAPVVHPLFGLLFVLQAGLLIYRVTSHIITMGRLSDHYGVEGRIPFKYRILIQRILYIFVAIGALNYIFISDSPSTPFSFLIAVGGFLLAILYNRDPLSSLPIAQPMQALAMLREGEVLYLHVFSSSGETVAQQEDFGALMTTLGQFYREIMRSETRIRSISTKDVLLMFEMAGEDYLVLVLKHRAPLVRRILRSVAGAVIRENPMDQVEFSGIVQRYLLFE